MPSSIVHAYLRPGSSGRDCALAASIFFFALVLAVATYDAARPGHSLVAAAGTDFRAFYCAGEAIDRHADPYLVEPLRSCEHRVQPSSGWSQELVTPAPLPRYALTPFALLARLPYGIAKNVWLAVLAGSFCITAFALARLTRLPLLAVVVGLCLADGYVQFTFGQIPPLVVASLALAGYLAERGSFRAAGIAVAATLIEPQIGIPAAIAGFLWWPRARLSVAFCVAAIAGWQLAIGGLHGTIAYLGTVLPEQARSELIASDQFGLSHEAFALGIPADLALRAGSISYVVALACGIVVARRAAIALASPCLIVFVPVAIVLLGGTYIHDVQFAAAFPAAYVLAARAARFRWAAWLALALLAFPWLSLGTSPRPGLLISALFIATTASVWLAASALAPPRRKFLVVAACVAIVYVSAVALDRHLAPAPNAAPTPIAVADASPNAGASQNWGAYLRSEPALSGPSPRREAAKIPYWLAISLIVLTAAAQKSRKEA